MTRYGTFDRPKSKARKKEIATTALWAMKSQKWELAAGPVGIHIFFTNPNPRADLDNLAKLVLDALSKILWADDSQVKKIYAEKENIKGEPPMTTVTIWDYPEVKL